MAKKILDELEKINACIHCGICLSACPTYLTTGNEGNSPRGRLYLIKDMIQGVIPELDGTSREYLDNCLACQACETACPSGVQYIDLLDYARHDKEESTYTTGLWGLIRKFSFTFILEQRAFLNLGRLALKLMNVAYKVFPALPKLNKIQPQREISYTAIQRNKLYRSSEDIPGKLDSERTVIFNLGCVMDTLYNSVQHDTIKVLNAVGYHVYVADSKCCGALAAHSGEFDIGENHTNHFIQAQCDALNEMSELGCASSDFSNPIVFNSAGCGAHMKDKIFSESLIIKDIGELLDTANWQAPLPLEQFQEKIFQNIAVKANSEIRSNEVQKIKAVYHPACHLHHAQGLTTQYQSLLALVPDLELIPFMEAEVCCGSAGFYNLIKPKLAELIGERKARNIKDTGANLLITANPGCMSQIEAHLGEDYQVQHPMSFLAKFL